MLSRTEIERLAASAHDLRPDWPISSLVTWLQADHAHRAYRDVAVALAYVATDSDTRTPKRMNETGPWWGVGPAAAGTTDIRFERCQKPGHTSFPAWNCGACRSEEIGNPDPAAPVVMVDDEQRQMNARWVEKIRAATKTERAGTGAGEAADPDSSEAPAGVTRSTDCPEAPAQARPLDTKEASE